MSDLDREHRRQLAQVADALATLEHHNTELATERARVRVVLDHAWEQDHRWDQFVAWVHGGPVPALTPGAQAILAKHGRRNDPF